MAYNEFTFPNKTEVLKKQDNTARIAIYPCYPGYGITLGNSLRRVLLSSIPGGAVTSVKIKGANHEFTTIKGVYEKVIDIILNIKELRFKVHTDKPVKVDIKVKGKKKVTGKNIEKNSEAEVVNPDHYICELTEAKSSIEMELTVEKGIGFSPVDRRESKKQKEIGLIEVDTSFSPVMNVAFDIETTRVGKRIDYDKLVMAIETDGSLTPVEALKQANELLAKNYALLANVDYSKVKKEMKEELKVKEVTEEGPGPLVDDQQGNFLKEDEDVQNTMSDTQSMVEDMEIEKFSLPEGLVNTLKKASIKTGGDLLEMTEKEILSIKGIGASALKEIKKSFGKFGMVIKKG